MALNTDINMPPVGSPPFRIYKEWCMGDSLDIININFDNFDTRITELSTLVLNLSAQVAACCGGGGPGPGPGPGPVTPKVIGLVDQTFGGGNTNTNCFIMGDGTMRVIGKSSSGELGIGQSTTGNDTPRVPLFSPQLETGELITNVVPQGDVIFVVTSLGRLYGAGMNNSYQLGLGDTVKRYVFTRIYLTVGEVDIPGTPKPANLFVKKIAPGGGGLSSNLTVFALTSDGSVYVWGDNSGRQSGTTSIATKIVTPLLSTLISNVRDIVSGGNSAKQTTFFIKNDNTLWVTGENTTGAAGIGSLYTTALPPIPLLGDIKNRIVQVTAGTGGAVIGNNVKSVYCGGETGNLSAWVITDTGKVFGTGYNNDGQAKGSRNTPVTAPVKQFTQIPQLATLNIDSLVGHVDKSNTTIFALENTGTAGEYKLWGWGNNGTGCLGNNTVIDSYGPIAINGPWVTAGAKVAQVCVAGDQQNKTTLVLDSTGVLWTSGYGVKGLIGNGLNVNQKTFQRVSISPGYGKPVLIRSTNTSRPGISNFLVMMDTGRVIAWGYDASTVGQLAVNIPASLVLVPSYVQIAV